MNREIATRSAKCNLSDASDVHPGAASHYLLVEVDVPAAKRVFACAHVVRAAGGLISKQIFPTDWPT